MNNSVGIDIVEFARIEKMISERFINRILSDEEKVIYDNFKSDKRRIEFLAGRFAAKEAYTKLYKRFDTPLNFTDVKVLHDEFGAPYIKSTYKSEDNISVSISHSENYAVAICIKL
jgi:holo-[acyl-carrier protein] synthase